ncbi:MAG: threonine-phosphate decarboxylase CobD [Proteobacteria bacterium]|nr:threonine-phosphate decarboxylase CobD [Pseudomonadota bacterium]
MSATDLPRDHGGNIDAAIARFGGSDWIDLSTGINRLPYPLGPLEPGIWQQLPPQSDIARLARIAARAYGTQASLLPLAGAQAAIQLLPRLRPPGQARILAPTYNEHAASLRLHGWQVEEVSEASALAGADLAVIVNPNNPDGRLQSPDFLMDLAKQTGLLVVDESFMDATPALSLAPRAGEEGVIVLRSFGKFYGLAGVRLGFALGHAKDIAQLAALAGPWPVSGPAIEIGCRALADDAWREATAARLHADALKLDHLAQKAGWRLVGGSALFRLYETPDATAAQERLAQAAIWSRIFPYSRTWLRLGLPGPTSEWRRLAAALER